MKRFDVLLLNGGGMGSLVAAAMYAHQPRVAVMYGKDHRNGQKFFQLAAGAQAEHYSYNSVVEVELGNLYLPTGDKGPLADQHLLISAMSITARIGAGVVVWPVHAGEDFNVISRLTESAILLSQVAECELGKSIEIEMPLLEMTDLQLVEVGHQMDVPWEKSRSCLGTNETPCSGCAGCKRREAAFNAALLGDPMAARSGKTV